MEVFELIVLWSCATMLTLALVLGISRLIMGPNSMDRVVSLDTIVAVAQCAIALFIGFSLDPTTAPTIVALALVAFLGSVSIARFRVSDSEYVPVLRAVTVRAPEVPDPTAGAATASPDPANVPYSPAQAPGLPATGTGADGGTPESEDGGRPRLRGGERP